MLTIFLDGRTDKPKNIMSTTFFVRGIKGSKETDSLYTVGDSFIPVFTVRSQLLSE